MGDEQIARQRRRSRCRHYIRTTLFHHSCPPLLVVVAVAATLVAGVADAICPSGCQCDDETLEASCAAVGLEVMPIQLNPDVKRIDLQGNRIDSVHFTLGFYSNLRHLDLSRNRIPSLGANNFELQTKLVTLNVSGNDITSLGKDTFKGLKSLLVLDLSFNRLDRLESAWLAELTELRTLNLSGNAVSHVSERALERLPQLRVLLLSHNELTDVPAAALRRAPALQELGLAYNLIETVAEDSLPPLRDLRLLTLKENVVASIHRAAFDGVQSLQTLDLSDNNLTTVPTAQLSKLTSLTELDLSGNTFDHIDAVSFQSLFELRRLRLNRHKQLTRVDARAFVDNIKLQSVELEENERLETLPTRLFHGNPALEDVWVRGNMLSSLDASHFPLDRLRSLYLADNPLHCNCSLLWLWQLARKQRDAPAPQADAPAPQQPQAAADNQTAAAAPSTDITPRLDIDGIRCSQPQELHHALITDIPESQVRCDVSWLAVIIVTVVVTALFTVTCGLMVFMGRLKRCRKGEGHLSPGGDAPPLHHHSHLQNGAVLVLVSGKERPAAPDTPPPVKQLPPACWPDDDRLGPAVSALYRGAYRHHSPTPPRPVLNGSLKKPAHIVYV